MCVCVCGNCCFCCSRSCCQWLPLLISLPALYKSFVFCLTRPDPSWVGQGRPDHTIPLPATTVESSRVELRHVECSNSSQPIWQPLGVASSGLKTELRSVGRRVNYGLESQTKSRTKLSTFYRYPVCKAQAAQLTQYTHLGPEKLRNLNSKVK